NALEILNRMGAILSAELDLDRVVQSITDAGVALTGAQFGALFDNDADGPDEAYRLYALSGIAREEFEKLTMLRDTEVLSPTLKDMKVIRSDDIATDPRCGDNGSRL